MKTTDGPDLTGIRIYLLPGGWEVLAGRTDEDNDRLSIKIVRPNDWWFHARGVPGSHVVLRHRNDAEPDRDTLRAAAAIAAYHSKARDARQVHVTRARGRDVSKPRGAKPGLVSVRREDVIKVAPALPESISE